MTIAARAPIPFASRWAWPACAFLVLCAATLLLWDKQREIMTAERQSRFERDAALVTMELRERHKLNDQLLRTLAAYFETRRDIDIEEWRRFSERIRLDMRLPAARVFGFAPAVGTKTLETFEAAVRKSFNAQSFKVFPRTGSDLAVPVIYLAPEAEAAAQALGFDIYSEDIRRQAVDRAMMTGDTVITSPLTLILDRATPTPGFLMLHPIYRLGMPTATAAERQAAFAGVVYAAFRVRELMSFLEWAGERRIAFRMFDEDGRGNPPTLLYNAVADSPTARVERSSQHEVSFGHRNWILHFQEHRLPTRGVELDGPTQFLIAGLAVSLLLSLTLAAAADALERRQAAAKLARHRDELQSMVQQRTAELETALRGSQAAHRAKSEFLANMSHELRTPMHAILGFSGLGLERARAPDQEKLQQYFERIRQSAERLLELVNDLLDLSKLEAGHRAGPLADFDLMALVRRTIAELESLLDEKSIEVHLAAEPGPSVIHGNERQIGQVVRNLLSNAIKFSPAGGTITIGVAPSALVGRPEAAGAPLPALAMTFRDRGIGLPPDELHSIFEKFTQGSNAKSGAGGTGLGLAICREIVRAHHGTIAAKNNPDGGACFEVVLPIHDRSDETTDCDGDCIPRTRIQ